MMLSEKDMRLVLTLQVESAGGLVAFCRAKGLNHTTVSLMKNGVRPVSEPVANACGYLVERVFKKARRDGG